jgi:hypothetical protein
MRRGVTRCVEVLPAREQRHSHDRRRDRAVAEAVLQVESDKPDENEHRDLPRAAFPACQPACHDQQREPERRDQCFRDAVNMLRRERCEEQRSAARRNRVEHAEDARGRDEPRKDERASWSCALTCPAPERTGCPSKHRREIDGGLTGGGVERFMCRDLTHDQQRETGLQIGPPPDAEPEHEPGSQALGARRAGCQAEQQRRCRPDGQKHQERDGRAAGELIQRKRIRDRRPR